MVTDSEPPALEVSGESETHSDSRDAEDFISQKLSEERREQQARRRDRRMTQRTYRSSHKTAQLAIELQGLALQMRDTVNRTATIVATVQSLALETEARACDARCAFQRRTSWGLRCGCCACSR